MMADATAVQSVVSPIVLLLAVGRRLMMSHAMSCHAGCRLLPRVKPHVRWLFPGRKLALWRCMHIAYLATLYFVPEEVAAS